MLALLIVIAVSTTAYQLLHTGISPEEMRDMLDSDEWY